MTQNKKIALTGSKNLASYLVIVSETSTFAVVAVDIFFRKGNI